MIKYSGYLRLASYNSLYGINPWMRYIFDVPMSEWGNFRRTMYMKMILVDGY